LFLIKAAEASHCGNREWLCSKPAQRLFIAESSGSAFFQQALIDAPANGVDAEKCPGIRTLWRTPVQDKGQGLEADHAAADGDPHPWPLRLGRQQGL